MDASEGASRANFRRTADWISASYNAALASPVFRDIDRHLGHLTEKVLGGANEFSKAMDAEYLRTHIGGGWHRLFDGGHTPLGAWRAIRQAAPNDTNFEAFKHTLREYMKDLVTHNGMPALTFDHARFNHVAGLLKQHLGVSPEWLKDMVSLNATEALGAACGLASLLIALRSKDPERFAELLGSLGVSASTSGNPLAFSFVLLAALGSVAHAGARGKNVPMRERLRRVRQQIKKSAYPAGRGAVVTGGATLAAKGTLAGIATLAAKGVVLSTGGPISIGVGIGVGFGGHYAVRAAEKKYRKWQAEVCMRTFYTETCKARLLPSPI